MPTRVINGATFHFLDCGQGPNVVLLHGFPLDSRIWEAQIEALSDRYRVIAPDLRGFGQTASSEPFTMASLADDVHALLKSLGALPCVLAGLSMGGYIALALARARGSDLRGLVLVDTRAEADTPVGKENRDRMIELVKQGGAKAVAEQMFPRMLSPHTEQHRPDIARKLRAIMESQSPTTIEHCLRALRDRDDHTSDLPAIRVPTLIIVGQDDATTPPAVAEGMAKLIRRPTLVVIARAGHLSPMEQPDEVTTAMRRFLEEVTN